MKQIRTISDLDLSEKRVLIRVDFNVPIAEGKIQSDARIKKALPGIQMAIKENAAVILLSHLGQPDPTIPPEQQPQFSLAPVAEHLSKLLKKQVRLVKDWTKELSISSGEVVLCENVRFEKGECENSEQLSETIAKIGDIYINDAFGAAHREHASTCGVTRFIPEVAAGPLLISEVNALQQLLETPKRPLVAIIGGSKISTKLHLLSSLAKIADHILIGGGLANTFFKAQGFEIGSSICEESLIKKAETFSQMPVFELPVDVMVTQDINNNQSATLRTLSLVRSNEKIIDIGQETIRKYSNIINEAQTILWNGPMGLFEIDAFSEGTKQIAQAIAGANAFSVAGGGDTLSALQQFNASDKISYCSTGGGAFLSSLEGRILPAVKALNTNR